MKKLSFKARHVIGNHRDQLRAFMFYESQTIKPMKIRMVWARTDIMGFELWETDVTQAYLQSAETF